MLSLIPIFRTAFYTHPAWDDYLYSLGVHQALQAGGNLLDVLAAAAKRVAFTYSIWQGTFSSVFVFTLMPGVFSENLYFLTTFIMVGALSFCTFFLVETIVVRWLRYRLRHAVLLSVLTLFMQIQFMPNRAQGLYWFNGASYYTLFYSISLVLIALLIRIALCPRRVKPSLVIASGILGIVIGGSNYSTALVTLELSFVVSCSLWRKGKNAWRQTGIATLLLFVALIVSAAAPGNAKRAASGLVQMAPFEAIYRSIQRMGIYMGEWTRLPQIVYMASMAPFAYFASQRVNWRFRWPLLVCVFAFLLCASQLTPPYFAMSYQGEGRQINVYHYAYYLLVLFCEFYICGWVSRRRIIAPRRAMACCKRYLLPACIMLSLLFTMGCYGWGIEWLSSVEAQNGLSNGEPQRFDAAFEELRAQIMNSKGDVLVRNIEAPAYFYWPKLSEDPKESINSGLAEYYGAKSVAALPEE